MTYIHETERELEYEDLPEHLYTNEPDYTADRIDATKKIAALITAVASSEDPKPQVLPIMCGAGKSSSLSYIIRDVIQKDNGSGLLIVTDSVERMHSYVEKRSGGDEELKQFLDENRDKITILESGRTYEANWNNKEKTPILILTTQRYFNELNTEKFESLFSWENGRRDLVIFDEMPFMQSFVNIDNDSLNNILTALQNGIVDHVEPEERSWCIDQWKSFSQLMGAKLDTYYQIQIHEKKSYFIYSHPTGKITEDDNRFWSIVKRSRYALESPGFRTLQYLKAIHKLVTSPTLVFCGKRYNKRRQSFIVRSGNMDRIADIPAKALILDGTADISPEYDQNIVNIINCDAFKRDLSAMKIELVNVKATKNALIMHDWLAPAIEQYLAERMSHLTKPTVFTYQESEEIFRDRFITAHFGDIKGRNIYKDATTIAQVGMNRYDSVYYVALGMYSDPIHFCQIAEITDPAQQAAAIDEILSDTHCFRDIMVRILVADTEQNLFRGCIRDPFGDKIYTYLIMYDFNAEDVSGLKETIQSRYKDLQANVIYLEEPDEIRAAHDSRWASTRITQKRLVLDWVKLQKQNKPERIFTIKEMVSEIMLPAKEDDDQPKVMNIKQVKKLREKDPMIGDLFNQMKIPGTKKYCIGNIMLQ